MTTRESLLAAILSDPQDDTPRLIYADFLDDAGEADRARHVRDSILFARIGETNYDHPDWKDAINSLIDFSGGGECSRTGLLHEWTAAIIPGRWSSDLGTSVWDVRCGDVRASWHRGFLQSLTLSWADWLRHEAAIYWHQTQTVEGPKQPCPVNRDPRQDIFDEPGKPFQWRSHANCEACRGTLEVGTGRIPRPFVATAMPLEEVRLTTFPDPGLEGDTTVQALNILCGVSDGTGAIGRRVGRITFDRVECGVCEGTGLNRLRTPSTNADWNQECPKCHGRPLNLWTCDKWQGVSFVMPEARPFGVALEDTQPDGTVRVLVGGEPDS